VYYFKKGADEGLWKIGIFMVKAATAAKKSGVKKKPATSGRKRAASIPKKSPVQPEYQI
jgi:hypothetical protein